MNVAHLHAALQPWRKTAGRMGSALRKDPLHSPTQSLRVCLKNEKRVTLQQMR